MILDGIALQLWHASPEIHVCSITPAATMSDKSHRFGKVGEGDSDLQIELYEAVYAELRAIAAHKMAVERPGHTLQATALVNEAYLRLASTEACTWKSRAHFFGAAAEAMRRILVDSARRNRQLKRGGEWERVEFCEALVAAPVEEEELLLVNEALDTLAREDAIKAEIVKLRYFVGLNHQQIAEALDINEKTVRRHWQVARVRLYQIISEPPAPPEPGSLGRT